MVRDCTLINLFDTVGGRRFLLTVATQVLSSYLLYVDKLTSEAYSMVILGTVAAYIAGNTYQKTKTKDE